MFEVDKKETTLEYDTTMVNWWRIQDVFSSTSNIWTNSKYKLHVTKTSKPKLKLFSIGEEKEEETNSRKTILF